MLSVGVHVNQLIKPAVALMNRLPMFYKFSLISVLFLLPIIALSWLVISELNRSVDTMTRGVEGLEQLEKVDTLLAESMAYRDFRAPGKIKDDNELLSQSAESSETIDRILEELVNAEARFDESGNWSQQVAMLVEEWQTLKSTDSYQGNIDPQFKYYQEFVQKVRALLSATIEISGLGQDASRENLLLLGLLRESLPDARSIIGRARTFGTFALIDGQVGYNLSDALNEIYDELTNRASLLGPALTVSMDASPTLEKTTGDAVEGILESLVVVRDELDANIITPMRLELPWRDFNRTIENQLAHYDALKAGIFDVVGANLNSRLEGELQQRQLIIAALVIVLLVVVYLYVGFFMSVRTAINRFSTAARSVAEGDMTTHIQLDNRDELGELTTEFNNMTDHEPDGGSGQ